MTINLSTFAERFRRFDFDKKPQPESFSVYYKNDSSIGNRYIRWQMVTAKRQAVKTDTVIDKARLYKEITYDVCDWRHLFEGIHFGLITGPKTLAALEECLEVLRNDIIPADTGVKVRHVNRLGAAQMVDKPTFHNWTLTDKLGKIMSAAFFEDRKDQTLYSEDFVYVYSSHDGWSRSC